MESLIAKSHKEMHGQKGAVLMAVLGIGIVLALVLVMVATRSGRNRIDTVKNMKSTQEFYLADAGFNFLKTKITELNREGGAKSVEAFLNTQKALGWQKIGFETAEMGYFRLEKFVPIWSPLSVDISVQGSKDPTKFTLRYETVQGVMRVPSLAKYARYVEGNTPLTYTGGSIVDGEILVAGGINLTSSPVKFTRLVSTGQTISNQAFGEYDFGYRLNQVDIPTLNHVHVNSWDNFQYDPSKYPQTFESLSEKGGIHLMGDDPDPKNPSWHTLNSTGNCHTSGPCDTLFAGCYDTLGQTRRSPVVVAGSAVVIDLSKVTIDGDSVIVRVSPVIYDAGGDGQDWFQVGTPERRYARSYATFRDNAVIYFDGDVYLTGMLKRIPLTIASGDDVFLYGSFIGPEKTEVDSKGSPVTLGVVAQDRVYIHESSSRNLTIRAAILAENDEIIYADTLGVPDWKYGYVCSREIFDPVNMPNRDSSKVFADYFGNNYVWDNHRVKQSGFGREPEEECTLAGTCNTYLDDYGFAALPFPRTEGSEWKLTFEGSLITRNPGSKGPKNMCSIGWDCNSDPKRVTWSYDDNLGVSYPPKFPAPVVDDRNPSQIIGFKRKSF